MFPVYGLLKSRERERESCSSRRMEVLEKENHRAALEVHCIQEFLIRVVMMMGLGMTLSFNEMRTVKRFCRELLFIK